MAAEVFASFACATGIANTNANEPIARHEHSFFIGFYFRLTATAFEFVNPF
jgi:hypothetical protein